MILIFIEQKGLSVYSVIVVEISIIESIKLGLVILTAQFDSASLTPAALFETALINALPIGVFCQIYFIYLVTVKS